VVVEASAFSVGSDVRGVAQSRGLVLDPGLRGTERFLMHPAVMGAEEQLTAGWEKDTDVGARTAPIAAVRSGKWFRSDNGGHGSLPPRLRQYVLGVRYLLSVTTVKQLENFPGSREACVSLSAY
jgi:hypothetical protein